MKTIGQDILLVNVTRMNAWWANGIPMQRATSATDASNEWTSGSSTPIKMLHIDENVLQWTSAVREIHMHHPCTSCVNKKQYVFIRCHLQMWQFFQIIGFSKELLTLKLQCTYLSIQLVNLLPDWVTSCIVIFACCLSPLLSWRLCPDRRCSCNWC